MGVHDYTCCVCGTPQTYACVEAEGSDEECAVTGIGEDRAFLTFHHFAAEGAPDSIDAFLERHDQALRRETFAFGFDWGAWEFQPSLNYYDLLMDDDERGVWQLRPHDPRGTNPVEVDVPAGETVWVVNTCPHCWDRFVLGKGEAPACRLNLQEIAEHLQVDAAELPDAIGERTVLPAADVAVQTPAKVERPEFHAAQEAENARIMAKLAEHEQASAPPEEPPPPDRGDFDDRKPKGFTRF